MSGDSVTNTKTEGSFEAYAKSIDGVSFKNETDGEAIIHFEASGEWSPGPHYGFIGPDGHQEQLLDNLQFPEHTAFALIANNKDWGAAYQVGRQNVITIPAGGTLLFLINDDKLGYSDNDGSLTIKWNKQS